MPEGLGFRCIASWWKHQNKQAAKQHHPQPQQPYQPNAATVCAKPSIKRKPINLSAEDQDLVNRSPGGRIPPG